MDQLGIADSASVAPMALVVVPVAVAGLALLLSIWPGRRAAARPPAAALRTE
jgi:ABC-type lipoprotein release transport system permease subunit